MPTVERPRPARYMRTCRRRWKHCARSARSSRAKHGASEALDMWEGRRGGRFFVLIPAKSDTIPRPRVSECGPRDPDWFAVQRDDPSRHKRTWQLRVSEPRVACLSAHARRRLAAILEHLEWVPHLIVHTVSGRLHVSRQFNTKMDREVHWFMVEHTRWTRWVPWRRICAL